MIPVYIICTARNINTYLSPLIFDVGATLAVAPKTGRRKTCPYLPISYFHEK